MRWVGRAALLAGIELESSRPSHQLAATAVAGSASCAFICHAGQVPPGGLCLVRWRLQVLSGDEERQPAGAAGASLAPWRGSSLMQPTLLQLHLAFVGAEVGTGQEGKGLWPGVQHSPDGNGEKQDRGEDDR